MRPTRINGGSSVEQLRADIDTGRTGDKVPAPDPAAAPLGTDDEAGGSSPSPDAVAQSRRIEISRAPEVRPRRGLGHAWILVAFIILFGAAFIVWAVVV
jgi:hypothetical protein